jgi:hypothetical protein
MKSKLRASLNYNESKALDDNDFGYSSTIYEHELFGNAVEIALGKENYSFNRHDVVYYSIYLIVNSEPKSRIGVFEIDSNQLINIIDEDGDLDLSKGNILIFINEDYLRGILNEKTKDEKTKEIDELADIEKGKIELPEPDQEIDDQIDDEIDVMRLNIPETNRSTSTKIADEELKNDVFSFNSNTNIPSMLSNETLEQANEIKMNYKENSRHVWVSRFMKNENYNIIDNEGGGDCAFAVIRDAFKQIGKVTTVEKLRALLSKEATDEMFQESRMLYINFLAEFQEKESELKDIKKTMQLLKKRCQKALEKCENEQIVMKARALVEKNKELLHEKNEAKILLNEFEYMRSIDSLEKFKQFIMTRDYWADTWAISTLEKILNFKMIILSEEAYKTKDYDSILNCGQLNDDDLEKQGQFKPDYYIICSYTGNHYKLVTYHSKNIFSFSEIPYDIRIMVINKCMEKNAGPYYLIEDFRRMKTKFGLNPNEGQPTDDDDDDYLTKDLYEKDIVFMFHSNSNKEPKAGRGSGEKINEKRLLEFNSLNRISDWRKKLDDSWLSPFTIDSNRWNSVEHYCLGSQFKKGFPDFYLQFSLDSGSDISKDLAIARIAGGKTGRTKDKVLRDAKIKIDPDFYSVGVNPRNKEERMTAIYAKFTQNMDLGAVLRDTKLAKLVHFVRSREPEVDELLMKVRKEIRQK